MTHKSIFCTRALKVCNRERKPFKQDNFMNNFPKDEKSNTSTTLNSLCD